MIFSPGESQTELLPSPSRAPPAVMPEVGRAIAAAPKTILPALDRILELLAKSTSSCQSPRQVRSVILRALFTVS